MSLFNKQKKVSGGGFKAPKWDPYGIWKQKSTGFLGVKKDKQTILPGVTWSEENSLKNIQNHIEKATGEKSTLPQHMINDVYSMYMNKDFKRKSVTRHTKIKQKAIDKVYNSLTKVVTQDSQMFSQMVTKEIAIYLTKIERQLKEEMEKNGQKCPDGESPFDQSLDGQDGQPGGDGQPGEGDGEGEGQGEGGEGEGNPNGSLDTGDQRSTGAGKGKPNPGDGHGDLGPQDPNSRGNGSKESLTKSSQAIDKAMDDILDDSEGALNKALDKAEKDMKDLEEKLGKEALKDLDKQDLKFLDEIDNIKAALNRIDINKDSIKNVLSKILNKSQNYFSKNAITVEESIFDSEEIESLFGLEYLHPIFGKLGLLDIGNESKIYTGKIDLYLDCSGSMDDRETFDGTRIRMIDLVKGIAMVLYRMGMIDKLYFFDNYLYEIENINEFSILGFDRSGGTNFNEVVRQCTSNGRNSVVITDGQDSVQNYIKNVFWVGVGGTKFNSSYGGGGAFQEYRKTGQCVTYNSGSGKFDYCK